MLHFVKLARAGKLNAAQQKALNDYFTALRTFEKEEEE
jgi:hypothetical protein